MGVFHALVQKVSRVGSTNLSQESVGRISSMSRTCSEGFSKRKFLQNGASASLFYLEEVGASTSLFYLIFQSSGI